MTGTRRLWATRTGGGAGEPVILCHGGPGLWDTLEEPAALLPDTPAYRWDQRGSGRSQRSGPYSIERSVADLSRRDQDDAGGRRAHALDRGPGGLPGGGRGVRQGRVPPAGQPLKDRRNGPGIVAYVTEP
ncbi:alpha/beta fold hydrolase [Streptomyces scopuliridis]|uniref:alpha/beta fold hydrolase n=1 Tax=Streptomyces scopuliridis TaxID=452529 RepID=UPI00369C21A9